MKTNMYSINPIADTSAYTSELAKSMIDKIFFLDKVDANIIIDFGCADGVLLDFISKIFPELTLIGYDLDPEMIQKAIDRGNENIHFTTSWDNVEEIVSLHKGKGHKSCLLMSSVIHEAHSYLSKEDLETMWDQIWGKDAVPFDYIAIRDMMVSRATSRPADPIQVARVRQIFDTDKLDEWEGHWGAIDENWSLVHFLLTYRYEASWKRELQENYLPVNYESFMSSIPAEFMPVFKEHFTLPFLRRKVKSDFGIDLVDRTHIKLVLERT